MRKIVDYVLLLISILLFGVSIDGYVFSLRSQGEEQGAMGNMFVAQIAIVATIINSVLVLIVLNKVIKRMIITVCIAMVLMTLHLMAMK